MSQDAVRAVTGGVEQSAVSVRALAARLWRRVVRRPIGRLLLAARRRAAIRRVRARGTAGMAGLGVSQGNICRSPYAAGALARALARMGLRGIAVHSAGFLEPGRPAPSTAVAAAARRGVDLSAHRSRRIDALAAHQAGLVMVMDAHQARAVGVLFGKPRGSIVILADLLPAFGEARAIPDPVDQPLDAFARVYGQIDD